MSFPFIQFSKSTCQYDFVSPVINFIGNSIVTTIGGISLAIVSYAALKALGVSSVTISAVTAVPITIGIIGIAGAIGGTFFLGVGIYALISVLRNR